MVRCIGDSESLSALQNVKMFGVGITEHPSVSCCGNVGSCVALLVVAVVGVGLTGRRRLWRLLVALSGVWRGLVDEVRHPLVERLHMLPTFQPERLQVPHERIRHGSPGRDDSERLRRRQVGLLDEPVIVRRYEKLGPDREPDDGALLRARVATERGHKLIVRGLESAAQGIPRAEESLPLGAPGERVLPWIVTLATHACPFVLCSFVQRWTVSARYQTSEKPHEQRAA